MAVAAVIEESANTAPDLRAHADAVFERVSPYAGGGFRHHCRRLHRFACALLDAEGLELDRDVAYMIAMWHDLGLVTEQDEGHDYLQRSRALFHREANGLELPGTDPEVLDQCLLYNHRLQSVPNLGPEAECFRKAVMIEHSRGLLSFGVDRSTIKIAFEEFPWDNFERVLLDFAWRTIKREPLTLVRGIFF
jgi:hypothetical protein